MSNLKHYVTQFHRFLLAYVWYDEKEMQCEFIQRKGC